MSSTVTKQDLKEAFDDFGIKIFKYLDKEFKTIHNDIAEMNHKFSDLQSTVDAYAKQVEIYHQESAARDAQVDRLQRWIEQLARHTGVKLEY